MQVVASRPRRIVIAFAAFIGVFAGTLGVGVEPAQAVDCAGPASVCAQLDTSTSTTPKPSESSSDGTPCSQSLPASPVTICGTASIRFTYSVGQGGAQVMNLPASMWMGWYHNYAGQCTTSSYQAWDAAEGAYVRIPANGVGWIDKHWWTPDIRTSSIKRTVTVAKPATHTSTVVVQAGYWKTVNKKKVWVPPVTKTVTTTDPVVPVTVDVYKVIDNIGYQGSSTRTQTFSTPGTYTYMYTEVTMNPWWTGRSVTFSPCYYPSAPKLVVNQCPTEVGPGQMTGPSGNAVSTFPVAVGPGKYDPKTEKRIWRTRPATNMGSKWVETPSGGILYSDIGMKWRQPGATSFFSQKDSTAALAYARDCESTIEYNTTAINQPCQYLGTTYPDKYGQWLPASDPLCKGFVPGNYLKTAAGKQSKCQYVQYYWDLFNQTYTNKQRFIKCDVPKACADCAIRAWAHWKCNDATGSNGRNETYDFINCNVSKPGPDSGGPLNATCTVASKQPQIFDSKGKLVPNGSQAFADGKPWLMRWLIPKATVAVKDQWMQWIMAGNSSPYRTGLGLSDPTQPIFASDNKNASPLSADNILTTPGSAEGKPGWTSADLWVRAYQGGGANNAGSPLFLGSERKDGGLRINDKDTIPFGAYLAFLYTYDYTTSTGMGGPVTLTIPVTCGTEMGYLYWLSGRVTQ